MGPRGFYYASRWAIRVGGGAWLMLRVIEDRGPETSNGSALPTSCAARGA